MLQAKQERLAGCIRALRRDCNAKKIQWQKRQLRRKQQIWQQSKKNVLTLLAFLAFLVLLAFLAFLAELLRESKKIGKKTEAELVQEGILVKTARGFALAPVFIELCEENYPDKMPADILFELGIKISDVKSYRLTPLM